MDLHDTPALQRRLFREKRAQLEQHLNLPLLLFWGKGGGFNIRALTLAEDFSRPAFVLCEPGGRTTAVAHAIETDQLTPLADRVEVIPYRTITELEAALGPRLRPHRRVAVEISDHFYGFDLLTPRYLKFIADFAELRVADDILVPFRAVKTPVELQIMKEASTATMKTFAALAGEVAPGRTEDELLRFIEMAAVRAGGQQAFPPIVAAGPRSENPHPLRRSSRRIEAGERVVVDCGVDLLGYKADVTRTYVAAGSPSDDPFYHISVELQELVKGADLKRMTPAALGRAAAEMVQKAGLGRFERHGYGHGLGVETHDPHPYIAAAGSKWLDKPFEDGMVFTFEPGFYDGRGGFRLEDDYVVRRGRAVPMQDFTPPA